MFSKSGRCCCWIVKGQEDGEGLDCKPRLRSTGRLDYVFFVNGAIMMNMMKGQQSQLFWLVSSKNSMAFVVSSVSGIFWLFSPQKSPLHLIYSRHLSFLLFLDSFGTMPSSQLSNLSVCVRFSLICGTCMSDYRIDTIYNVSCLHV